MKDVRIFAGTVEMLAQNIHKEVTLWIGGWVIQTLCADFLLFIAPYGPVNTAVGVGDAIAQGLSLADDIVGIDGAFVFQCLDARGDSIGNTVKIAVGNGFGPLYSGTAAQSQ